MQAKDHLERVYRARTPQELWQAYRDWAPSYESDLVDGLGWDKPTRVGEALLRWLSPPARILDVGAGTGLVGQFLASRGFADLTALDFSPQMLERARQRQVYQQFLELDLNSPLPLPNGHYDAVTAVGIFTEGHVAGSCLAELARVVRPGGLVAFSLRDDLQHLYAPQAEAISWRLMEREVFRDGLEHRPWSAWIYRVALP